MSDNGTNFPRFFTINTAASIARNKMKLPAHFLTVYGDYLPKKLTLQVETGNEIDVVYKKHKKKVYGIASLFAFFEFEDEICNVFEYDGNGIFTVYVFNCKFVDRYRSCTGFSGNDEDYNMDVGWKFVSICQNGAASDHGFVKIPPGHVLPPQLCLTLPNGQVFTASYSTNDRMICGLRIFLLHDVLMLTYRGNGAFDIVLFDHTYAEKSFSPYAHRLGAMVGISWHQFKIEIQRFHLYPYCYGIDIHADYSAITDKWGGGDHLTVSHEGNVFFLGIRLTGRRWKLHSGWVRFWHLLNLEVGDVLVFNMTTPPLGFSVRVYRFAARKDQSG